MQLQVAADTYAYNTTTIGLLFFSYLNLNLSSAPIHEGVYKLDQVTNGEGQEKMIPSIQGAQWLMEAE